MSPQDSSTRKRLPDVYTVMLFVAAIALAIGCILLYSELNAYGSFPWWRPSTGGTTSWIPSVADRSYWA